MARTTRLERDFEARLIDALETMFPGCLITKGNSAYVQGIPDRLILWGPHWAMLEVKRSIDEPYRPNQEWYIDELNKMSFAAMICPENMEDVLNALQQSFGARRTTRFSQR